MMADNMGYIGTYTTFLWITINGVPYEEHLRRDDAAIALAEMAGE
jgi:hypothetical protein